MALGKLFGCLIFGIGCQSLPGQTSANIITILPTSSRSAVGELRLRDKQSPTHYVGFKAADTIIGNVVWTLPPSDTAGVLVSDGSAILTLTPTPILDRLTIKRLGVTRVDILGGGPGSGGIITTLDTAGTSVINTLSSTGITSTSDITGNSLLLTGGYFGISNAATATISQLNVNRATTTRVMIIPGAVGAGGIITTFDASGVTAINTLDQNGVTTLGYVSGASYKLGSTTIVDTSNNHVGNSFLLTGGTLGISSSGIFDGTAVQIQRATVPRAAIYSGGVSSGGIIQTLDSSGSIAINLLNDTGITTTGTFIGTQFSVNNTALLSAGLFTSNTTAGSAVSIINSSSGRGLFVSSGSGLAIEISGGVKINGTNAHTGSTCSHWAQGICDTP